METCPRVDGKPLLLFEPGHGMQVGCWDARSGQFVSPSRSFGIPFKLGRIRDVEDLYRKVPIHATRWADVDLIAPEEEEVLPDPAPAAERVQSRPVLRLIDGGRAA